MNEKSRKFLNSLKDNTVRVDEDDDTCTIRIYVYDTLVHTLTYEDIDAMDEEDEYDIVGKIVSNIILLHLRQSLGNNCAQLYLTVDGEKNNDSGNY